MAADLGENALPDCYNVLPIKETAIDIDLRLDPDDSSCAKYRKASDTLKKSVEYKSMIDSHLRLLVPRFKQLLGPEATFTDRDISQYCSSLMSDDYDQKDLKFDYTQSDVDLCSSFKSLPLYYIAYGDKDLHRIASKLFLESVYEEMEKIIDGDSELKMRLNFAHDTTLTIFLNGLGFEQKTNPPFASTIFFELWHDQEKDSHFVRTLYNDEPITFGSCKEVDCKFFTFK